MPSFFLRGIDADLWNRARVRAKQVDRIHERELLIALLSLYADGKVDVVTAEKPHRVVRDAAGPGGHERLTCTECNSTLVRQLWMGDARWAADSRELMKAHGGGAAASPSAQPSDTANRA